MVADLSLQTKLVCHHESTSSFVLVKFDFVLDDSALMNGVFDSSFKRNQPIEFSLGVGQVIPGWDEGIALLNKGAKATLIIPSDLAYGAAGAGGVIPPNATLKFEVELVDFK